MKALVTEIKRAAAELGFQVAGITSAGPFQADAASLVEWRTAGFAAGMEYMQRRASLFEDPRELMHNACSIISLAVNYYSEAPRFEHEGRYGRIARYAWGRDYHDVVKPRLHELAARIEQLLSGNLPDRGGFKYRCFVDAVPLLERAAARRADLGFFGKNTNLIQPRAGSWFFLSELLVNVPLPEDPTAPAVSCGTCTRCMPACPTGAFAGPYRLDSRLCISYLTIENKGPIPRDLRPGIGEWLFGCDVCQEVCPFNRFSRATGWPELESSQGPGPRVSILELLSIGSDDEFRGRFRGTSLMRAKRRGLLRNAAVVAANIGCEEALPRLVNLISDAEPLIRGHAIWSASKLGLAAAKPAIQAALRDPVAWVRDEAAATLQS